MVNSGNRIRVIRLFTGSGGLLASRSEILKTDGGRNRDSRVESADLEDFWSMLTADGVGMVLDDQGTGLLVYWEILVLGQENTLP